MKQGINIYIPVLSIHEKFENKIPLANNHIPFSQVCNFPFPTALSSLALAAAAKELCMNVTFTSPHAPNQLCFSILHVPFSQKG